MNDGFVKHFLLPPTGQHFDVLPFILQFLSILSLSFLGLVFISSLLSVVYNKIDQRLSRSFMGLTSRNSLIWFMLGIVAYLCLPLLFGQIWYGAGVPISFYLEMTSYVLIAGFVFLFLYQRLEKLGFGILGHGLLSIACLFHIYFMSLMLDPGQWAAQAGKPSLVHISHFIWVYSEFVLISVMLTGASCLFFYFTWPNQSEKDELDLHRLNILKRWGTWAPMVTSMLIPLVLILEYFTIPTTSLAFSSIGLAMAMIIALFVIAILSLVTVRGGREYGREVFFLSLFVMGIYSLHLDFGQAAGSTEFRANLARQVHKTRAEEESTQEKFYVHAAADMALGKKVFESRCTACHSWNARLVGPSFKDIVKKYDGKLQDLESFIRNPSKVDPNFPAMPNPGLTEGEVKSVAVFVLEEGEKEESKNK